MLFNSLEFALFLPVVFLLYWFVFDYALKNCKHQLQLQNAFVVAASYLFYGWWDWRFLILIAFTSLCSWGSGLLIGKAVVVDANTNANTNTSIEIEIEKEKRTNKARGKAKFWMILNIVINLAILATFKYYDFFVSEFCQMFGMKSDGLLLRVILPVGISFYTFQALSYSIDVYRGKIEPTKDIVAFFAFISFFPQLVAGPIERATNLLPQFLEKREFTYEQGTDGMRQILWGLFKKIVVADNCAVYVDQVWSNYSTQSGSTLLLAAVLFTFQIYGDFSGYSDIAIGTAKLFGIRLMRNFSNPYFSRDIAEFWRRWHISLTTWFRDYVYIPLGGSRPDIPADSRHPEIRKKFIIARNTFVIFLLSGFWHGANWTFIAWGAYHALLFLPLILLGKNRKYTNQVASYIDADGTERLRLLPTWKEAFQMLFTFVLVVIGWIIFRSETISQAWEYIIRIFNTSLFYNPHLINRLYYVPLSVFLLFLIIIEWIDRNNEHGLVLRTIKFKVLRSIIYIFLFISIEFYFVKTIGQTNTFIYFQF